MRQSQREQHVSHHAQDGNNDLQMPQQQLELVVRFLVISARGLEQLPNGRSPIPVNRS
jgi:hypothetical protein